jgi:NitT/TauT family transport system permease protein
MHKYGSTIGWQLAILALLLLLWQLASRDAQVAFFFGEPAKVAACLLRWFTQGSGKLEISWGDNVHWQWHFPAEIYPHLLITLSETLLAFILGTLAGLVSGLWLGLSPLLTRVLRPFINAANVLPRVVLAPIFSMWFGLGMGSKVALAVTLVFFTVFFNVYQGVREVNPVWVNNLNMLGANSWQRIKTLYLPSALSWVFCSLHNAIGLAFIGAVVGEYLGSARGIGYLILQAEGSFDINTIFAGIIILTLCALLLDSLVSLLERKLLKWQPDNQRQC